MKTVKKANNVRKSRKEVRKAKRLDKKAKRNEYFTKRQRDDKIETESSNIKTPAPAPPKLKQKKVVPSSVVSDIAKEKKVEKTLMMEMRKQRNKQMIQANWEEDKNIKKLEKQLKLNKRKSKTIPKTFAADGLDYLLEVCNTGNMSDVIGTEMQMDDVNDDFDEDFHLMMGGTDDSVKTKTNTKSKTKGVKEMETDSDESDNEFEADDEEFQNDENDFEDDEMSMNSDQLEDEMADVSGSEGESMDSFGNDEVEDGEEDIEASVDNEEKDSDGSEGEDVIDDDTTLVTKAKNEENTWQDIYGRLRDKDGNILNNKEPTEKYIPPAARAARDGDTNANITRLKRQLKGLINRLAESNMHSISSQIETLYATNSRHDMNETLAAIMFENIIAPTLCPERLLLEHALLVAILHANIGSEVGAFFLQTVAQKFCTLLAAYAGEMADKRMDNAVNFIAQLYNFKLVSSQLLHEVLTRLADHFDEKHVECILSVLKSVGITLRKDDPAMLKTFIQKMQAKAASDAANDNPRVKFMLDILLAIRNNNVSKIPNYDTTYSEHLKKIAKSFIRKGNYVTQMNIGLDDLLKADDRGKWWIVGSAWTGKSEEAREQGKEAKTAASMFSQKLIALAKKQHMNTDTRMNIFCILMSAEDYMDGFEKLLHLGLKNQQEREIINVLLHCCLSEKVYNPYYSVLAQKFCDYDRRFQMIIKCSIWDKLQALRDCSPAQISNLAKLLTHLFLEKGLPISVLKIVQFGELDKTTLRFMRQILLGVLLTPDAEQCQEVFQKVALSEKLKMFRESLRLFVHHFLLRNLGKEGQSLMDAEQKTLLEERARIVDKILMSAQDRKRKAM